MTDNTSDASASQTGLLPTVEPASSLAGSAASIPSARDYRKMTQPERARLRQQYAEAQRQKCHHCGCNLSEQPSETMRSKRINWRLFPGGELFLRHPVHLHHSHKTGRTIGAVHALCNAVLWQYHGE